MLILSTNIYREAAFHLYKDSYISYMFECIHVCLNTSVTHVHEHASTHIHSAHKCACKKGYEWPYMLICTCPCTHLYANTHKCICKCWHTCTYMYVYRYTHIHIQSSTQIHVCILAYRLAHASMLTLTHIQTDKYPPTVPFCEGSHCHPTAVSPDQRNHFDTLP